MPEQSANDQQTSEPSQQPFIADINALMRASEVNATAEAIAEALVSAGHSNIAVHIADVSVGCEPDNMLVTEYEQRFDMPPVVESLHRIVVGGQGRGGVDLSEVTKTIAAALPKAPDGSEGLWYGGTRAGRLQDSDLSIPIACRLA